LLRQLWRLLRNFLGLCFFSPFTSDGDRGLYYCCYERSGSKRDDPPLDFRVALVQCCDVPVKFGNVTLESFDV
jgi:hypothetical protein